MRSQVINDLDLIPRITAKNIAYFHWGPVYIYLYIYIYIVEISSYHAPWSPISLRRLRLFIGVPVNEPMKYLFSLLYV